MTGLRSTLALGGVIVAMAMPLVSAADPLSDACFIAQEQTRTDNQTYAIECHALTPDTIDRCRDLRRRAIDSVRAAVATCSAPIDLSFAGASDGGGDAGATLAMASATVADAGAPPSAYELAKRACDDAERLTTLCKRQHQMVPLACISYSDGETEPCTRERALRPAPPSDAATTDALVPAIHISAAITSTPLDARDSGVAGDASP